MMRVEDLETPVPVIDLDRVEHNLSKLQAYCDAHTLRLRPHIKTHKIPAMARRQLELGHAGSPAKSSARPRSWRMPGSTTS